MGKILNFKTKIALIEKIAKLKQNQQKPASQL